MNGTPLKAYSETSIAIKNEAEAVKDLKLINYFLFFSLINNLIAWDFFTLKNKKSNIIINFIRVNNF